MTMEQSLVDAVEVVAMARLISQGYFPQLNYFEVGGTKLDDPNAGAETSAIPATRNVMTRVSHAS